jgi:hypothetical protein
VTWGRARRLATQPASCLARDRRSQSSQVRSGLIFTIGIETGTKRCSRCGLGRSLNPVRTLSLNSRPAVVTWEATCTARPSHPVIGSGSVAASRVRSGPV